MPDKTTTRTQWAIQWQRAPRGKWHTSTTRDSTSTDLARMLHQLKRHREIAAEKIPEEVAEGLRYRIVARTIITTTTPWKEVPEA